MAFSVVGRVTEGAKLTTQQVAPILPQAKHYRQPENNGVPEPELAVCTIVTDIPGAYRVLRELELVRNFKDRFTERATISSSDARPRPSKRWSRYRNPTPRPDQSDSWSA
jgi:hypothetical protein